MSAAAFATSLVTFLLTRAAHKESRTDSALETLFASAAVGPLLYLEPKRDERLADKDEWHKYERDVVKPAAGMLERFAAMTNPRRWQREFYSFQLVERVASATIQSLWKDTYVEMVVEEERRRTNDPTIYIEFETLAEGLKELDAKPRPTTRRQRNAQRREIRKAMKRKLIEAGVV